MVRSPNTQGKYKIKFPDTCKILQALTLKQEVIIKLPQD